MTNLLCLLSGDEFCCRAPRGAERSKSKEGNTKCAVGPKIWKVCWDDLAVTNHKSQELKSAPAVTALSPQQLAFLLFQLKPQLL